MSRIGKNPVSIPDGVKVDFEGSLVKVSGPKGLLEFNAHKDMKIYQSDSQLNQLPASHKTDLGCFHK